MSARDSEAVVAIDVNGACRLCARGTCWPVLYGESKEESVYIVRISFLETQCNTYVYHNWSLNAIIRELSNRICWHK